MDFAPPGERFSGKEREPAKAHVVQFIVSVVCFIRQSCQCNLNRNIGWVPDKLSYRRLILQWLPAFD